MMKSLKSWPDRIKHAWNASDQEKSIDHHNCQTQSALANVPTGHLSKGTADIHKAGDFNVVVDVV